MAQSITLTASMRSNLSSLKGIQKQMNTTQERLSTGKKVNSAIDNASSYYQSRSLTNRASDLEALLDSMGQGIQTIQAANEGIEAVTSFVDQLKSIAQSAFAAASGGAETSVIKGYEDQYNDILSEMYTLIKDSGYQGINLLDGGTLNVTFDENRLHALEVDGDVLTTEMSNLKDSTGAVVGTDAFSWDATNHTGNVDWGTDETLLYKYDTYTMTPIATGAVEAGKYMLKDGAWTQLTEDLSADEAAAARTAGATFASKATTATTSYAATVPDNSTTAWNIADGKGKIYINNQGETYASKIDDTLNVISKGLEYLRDYTSQLGNNYSIIQTRQDFTESLIDVLETGSDNLVLADMNEESANYLALQTRQQLAINSLSLASQSAQSVLKLF